MSATTSKQFRELHSNKQALVLINVWDAASAAIAQAVGSVALATSSASLAWANGYADGNTLPHNVLLSAISHILRVSKVPLTVDVEGGYSDSPQAVADLVGRLVELGVAGVNIEDGSNSPDLLIEKITAIRNHLEMESVFINARTDVYLQGLVAAEKCLDESIERLNKYIASGADGVFVPALTSLTDITTISSSVQAPLNIMVSSDTANLQQLINAGARRISVGPATFIEAYSTLPKVARKLLDCDKRLDNLTYDVLNEMF